MFFRNLLLRAAILSLAVVGAVRADKLEAAWRELITAAVRAGMAKNLPKAEQLMIQAVQQAGRFPPGDPRIGATFNSLGLIYREEKKYGDAEKAFEKALGILEQAYGTDSLDAGNVSFNIASVLMADGRYENAIPYIKKSRAVYLTILGPDSLKTTSTLCLIGEVYRNLKRFNEAEIPLKECADMREASGGLENPDLADAIYNLALVYEHQGKYALAEPLLRLSGKIREITLGVTSPEFAEALEADAALLKMMGRDQEAEKEEIMAAAVRRRTKKTQ